MASTSMVPNKAECIFSNLFNCLVTKVYLS